MKKVLITGANSYIGDSFRDYLLSASNEYKVVVKDTYGWNPIPADFEGFDVVFNVAGVAHIKETKDNQHLYYDINRDLVVRIATSAKEAGVRQFILLSTMSVYGLTVGRINKESKVNPITAYGKSKAEADMAIALLADKSFKFACLRPPMVYGKGCKGNYQSLRKFALKSPIFPQYNNQRSMIYIGNLCCFIKDVIDQEKSGLFLPQNADYIQTSEMVRIIAECHGKKIWLTKVFNWVIMIAHFNVFEKVFGSLTYESADTVNTFDMEESIRITEL